MYTLFQSLDRLLSPAFYCVPTDGALALVSLRFLRRVVQHLSADIPEAGLTPYDSTQWGLPLLTHSVVYQFASQFTTSSQKFQHWELQRCYSSGMAITSDEARRLFGKFIGFNKMLSEQQDVNNYYGFAYRMDTWQLWADCEDEHLPSSRMLCAHGGLHITIIDSAKHMDKCEFAVMVGPFDLMTGDDPELLYRQMQASVKAVLATAQLPIHALGYPCHDDCECEQILQEENYLGPSHQG